MYVTTTNEKGVMNLIESKEGYKSGERKGKR